MIKRRVIRSRKEKNDITILGNPFEYWNPKYKDDIIEEIETGLYYYYIESENNTEIEIKIIKINNRKFLTTDSKLKANKLLELPDC